MIKKLVVVLEVCLSCVFAEKNGASAVSPIINVDENPVNLTEIKNLDFLELRTHSINAKDSTFHCGYKKGTYGTYEFLKRAATGRKEVIGTVLVYAAVSEPSWQQGNADEVFMSIKVTAKEIPLWNMLYVGMSVDTLLSLTPVMHYEKKSDTHVLKGNKFVARFTINNETVNNISVTTLCYED